MKKLDTRQKLLIVLIIVAFIFIIWQVYDIFFAAPKVAATPAPVVQQPTTTPATTNGQKAPAQAPVVPAPKQESVAKLSSSANMQKTAQYQRLLKQYQDLQAKRMMLQEQVAVAQTQQQITELNAKLSELGVTPGTVTSGRSRADTYSLMYLDNQNSVWSAAINDNGTPRNVVQGALLPDGTKVLSVDHNGVVIDQKGNITRLTFSGSVPIKSAAHKPKPKRISPIFHPAAMLKKKITPQIVASDFKPQPVREKAPIAITELHPAMQVQPENKQPIAATITKPITTPAAKPTITTKPATKPSMQPTFTIKSVPESTVKKVNNLRKMVRSKKPIIKKPVKSEPVKITSVEKKPTTTTTVTEPPKQLTPTFVVKKPEPMKITVPKIPQQTKQTAKKTTPTKIEKQPVQLKPLFTIKNVEPKKTAATIKPITKKVAPQPSKITQIKPLLTKVNTSTTEPKLQPTFKIENAATTTQTTASQPGFTIQAIQTKPVAQKKSPKLTPTKTKALNTPKLEPALTLVKPKLAVTTVTPPVKLTTPALQKNEKTTITELTPMLTTPESKVLKPKQITIKKKPITDLEKAPTLTPNFTIKSTTPKAKPIISKPETLTPPTAAIKPSTPKLTIKKPTGFENITTPTFTIQTVKPATTPSNAKKPVELKPITKKAIKPKVVTKTTKQKPATQPKIVKKPTATKTIKPTFTIKSITPKKITKKSKPTPVRQPKVILKPKTQKLTIKKPVITEKAIKPTFTIKSTPTTEANTKSTNNVITLTPKKYQQPKKKPIIRIKRRPRPEQAIDFSPKMSPQDSDSLL